MQVTLAAAEADYLAAADWRKGAEIGSMYERVRVACQAINKPQTIS